MDKTRVEKCDCNQRPFTYHDVTKNVMVSKCNLIGFRVDKTKKQLTWEPTSKKPCKYFSEKEFPATTFCTPLVSERVRAEEVDTAKMTYGRLKSSINACMVRPKNAYLHEIDILLAKFVVDWKSQRDFNSEKGIIEFFEAALDAFNGIEIPVVFVKRLYKGPQEIESPFCKENIKYLNHVKDLHEESLKIYKQRPYEPKKDDLLEPLSPPSKTSVSNHEKKDYEVFSDLEDSEDSREFSSEEELDSVSESSEIQDEFYER